ncbi:transmembrane protein 17B-like isoform X2 [Thalassophryne amazonica]|uniref:transmembrane protein 17B-like isoform X2 n=1 Tax=Thalassophryne amazonica TaxID=390379 RepID=UPI0014719F00|nr:transmembrane protein 17B-like isoform X2 [Thalassophryne amazonica]
MELPETIRRRLDDFSRNVLFDQTSAQMSPKHHDTFFPHDRQVLSSLHLQMSLFFNTWFFPLWWISEIVMLQLKYPALPEYYKFIVITVLILMTLIEAIRLYLGYAGNLHEKLFNEAILIQPLERGVHIVFTLFLLTQAFLGFVALRDMVRHTESQFHLRQSH